MGTPYSRGREKVDVCNAMGKLALTPTVNEGLDWHEGFFYLV